MRTQTTLMLCVFMGATLSAACSSPEAKKPDNTALIKETPQPVAKASPQEVDAAIKAADAQLAARDYKGAVELYQRAISMDPTRWEVHHNLAIAHSFIPNFDAAIASINEALKLGGERDARAWFTLGNLYQNRNMYEESIDAYRAGADDAGRPPGEILMHATFSWVEDLDAARAAADVWRATLVPEFFTEDWHDPREMQRFAQRTVDDREMLDSFIVATDPDEHVERIREVEAAGATTVVLMNISAADPLGAIATYGERVLPALRGARV